METYPKGSKDTSSRESKQRKRRFHGNQYSEKQSDEANISASSKKLSTVNSDDVQWNPTHGYRFIEFFTVFTALADLLICRECKSNIRFEETANRGLGFKLVLICNCGNRQINSGPFIRNGFEVNRRIVFVMRLLGVGKEGLNLFCNLMDVCSGFSNSAYSSIIEHIHSASKTVFERCALKAVEEEKKENAKLERLILKLKVSGDGSWKKRGFKSLYGVVTLIGYYSGKVIDFIVKSSYCQACITWKNKIGSEEYNEWYEEHEEQCSKNHEGSAGGMEVEGMKEMFLRSEEKFGVKYSDYIGDGDSKTFKGIIDLQPYGEEVIVKKSECVGHVEKRMGTRLRNAQKTHKLGGKGKGKLTMSLIKKLTTYYGLAIRRNLDSVEDMRKSIMATYWHMCSTEEKPRHENCPPGADSWCFYQKAVATDPTIKSVPHPDAFNAEVAKRLLPIYEDLSKDDLLERCLGGHTQNANESFNSTIWRFAPKHLNFGLKIVEVATHLAAGLFNEGYTFILQLMNESEIVVGNQARIYAEKMDSNRVNRQNRRSLESTKEARKARRDFLITQNEFYEQADGLQYGAGIAE